jgi:hypothetical protein
MNDVIHLSGLRALCYFISQMHLALPPICNKRNVVCTARLIACLLGSDRLSLMKRSGWPLARAWNFVAPHV